MRTGDQNHIIKFSSMSYPMGFMQLTIAGPASIWTWAFSKDPKKQKTNMKQSTYPFHLLIHISSEFAAFERLVSGISYMNYRYTRKSVNI